MEVEIINIRCQLQFHLTSGTNCLLTQIYNKNELVLFLSVVIQQIEQYTIALLSQIHSKLMRPYNQQNSAFMLPTVLYGAHFVAYSDEFIVYSSIRAVYKQFSIKQSI